MLPAEQGVLSEHVEILLDKEVVDLFVGVDRDERRAAVAVYLIAVVTILQTLEQLCVVEGIDVHLI